VPFLWNLIADPTFNSDKSGKEKRQERQIWKPGKDQKTHAKFLDSWFQIF
jgi:hypothetical protein